MRLGRWEIELQSFRKVRRLVLHRWRLAVILCILIAIGNVNTGAFFCIGSIIILVNKDHCTLALGL